MNKKSVLIIAMLGAFLMIGCDGGGGDGGGNGGDDDTSPPRLQNRTVYVNPDDSMLYSYTSEDGEEFTYYGRRDEAGKPQIITMVEYVDLSGERHFIYYDRNGLPAKVIDEQGTTLEFDYHLKVREMAETDLMAAYPIARAVKEIDAIGVTLTVPEDHGPAVTSAIVPLEDTTLVAPAPRIAEWYDKELGNLTIKVDQCGQPVHPKGEVWVIYQEPGKTERHLAFPMSDPGYYMSRIPREYFASPEDAENTCKSFAEALSTACSVFDPKVVGVPGAILMSNPGFQAAVCGAVAVKISAMGTPIAGTAAGTACGALLAGGTITCNTLGKSIPGDDFNYMDTFLCGQAEEMLEGLNAYFDIDKVTIQAFADFSNTQVPSLSVPGDRKQGVYASPKLEVSVWNAYPDLEISSSDPTIGEISTFPGTPDAGAPYTVTAEFNCASGMDLSITVTRDGALVYEDPFGDPSENRISIDVPGDPPGSVDTITISVIEPITEWVIAKKRLLVKLEESEPPADEAFEASVNIPGESISFRPINSPALITRWIDQQDAVTIVAREGNTGESEFISITINPNVVNGPGTYALAYDMNATAAMFSFATPEIKHANVGHPIAGTNVYFLETGGTITITQWGTSLGDIVSGSFSAQITGTRITGENPNGGFTTEELNGVITGSFSLEIIPAQTN